MINKVVIGLGFGDEGKGTVVDYLCSKSVDVPLVVRFNGGHQAGHTVYLEDQHHVFANFGSGTLRNIPTYWSKFCTVDPVGLYNEISVLKGKGVTPVLYIDDECAITTPCDIQMNLWVERENKHGSCGVGVGATFKREEDKYHLKFRDIFYPKVLGIKLDLIKKYYGYGHERTIRHKDLDSFLEAVDFLVCSPNIRKGFPKGFSIQIFEGAQGLLLDQEIGFFPHVTRSNTGTKNILKLVDKIDEIFLVTRAYQTRHGNGPMVNEKIFWDIKDNQYESNVYNSNQGKFRKTLLDLDLLLYAIESDKIIDNFNRKSLVVTCLDLIEKYAFTYKGDVIICMDELEFIKKISKILKIENVLINMSPCSKTFVERNF